MHLSSVGVSLPTPTPPPPNLTLYSTYEKEDKREIFLREVSSTGRWGNGDGRWSREVNIRNRALQLTSIGIIQQQRRQSRSRNVRKLHFHISQHKRHLPSSPPVSIFSVLREIRIILCLDEAATDCFLHSEILWIRRETATSSAVVQFCIIVNNCKSQTAKSGTLSFCHWFSKRNPPIRWAVSKHNMRCCQWFPNYKPMILSLILELTPWDFASNC